ncbi:MAG: extracellular solute-binding protein [bacterium]|nr:extracellular solute-binding protein [bacterium]
MTGIKINVVSLGNWELYSMIETELLKHSGKFDVLNVVPYTLPDLVNMGALEPLDAYVDKYGYREELNDIAPVYRNNQMSWNGTIYGIPDDGDVLVLYYRKDLFEDPDNQSTFQERYGYALAPPTSWAQFDDIAEFFTDMYAPTLYGCAYDRANEPYLLFQERFRAHGGTFFDAETMNATINSKHGITALTEMVNEQKFMPTGAEKWSTMDVFASFLKGEVAMIQFWPPIGRWAEGYGVETEQLAWVPKSHVVGNVGYAVSPGGHSQLALGYTLSVSADSKHKEAAYLFIQWLTSRKISLERVQLPYALRDPYRLSHYSNPDYRNLWPTAPSYLDVLFEAADKSLLDLMLLQIGRYNQLLNKGLVAAFTHQVDPKAALDMVAQGWDALTQTVGVEKQRAMYTEWASHPNAYPQ